jgi:hypothetical protein
MHIAYTHHAHKNQSSHHFLLKLVLLFKVLIRFPYDPTRLNFQRK